MVSLRYFAPAEDVRDLVSVYYFFDVDEARFADNERAAIAQLRFILDGKGTLSFADGKSYPVEGAMLVGPSTGAMHFDVTGPFRMFGVGMLPLDWAVTTKKVAAQYADVVLPAREVFTDEIDKNLDTLRGCDSVDEMVDWANKVYRSMKPRIKPETAAFTEMVDKWLSSNHRRRSAR